MEASRNLFQSRRGDEIYDEDLYSRASITELESMLRQGREALTSLEIDLMKIEGELMKRQPNRKSDQPRAISLYCRRLHDTASELGAIESLDSKTIEELQKYIDLLNVVQTTRPTGLQINFLQEIRQRCGRTLELLCAASLERTTATAIDLTTREHVISYILATRKLLDVPILQTLVNECNIPPLDSLPLVAILAHVRQLTEVRNITVGDTKRNNAVQE